ncbi:MAG: hypothetical protein ACXWFZ_13235 [Nitrososphaeraceae archaeon]
MCNLKGWVALDVGMTAVATYGDPAGWAIAGGYFLGDVKGLWGNWGQAK